MQKVTEDNFKTSKAIMRCTSALMILVSFVLCKTNAELFEGDIILDDTTQKIVTGKNSFDAIASAAKKWPGAVIPYTFESNFDQSRRGVVQQAILEYNKHTCIRFVPRTNQPNFVKFVIGSGCSSNIGMWGHGMQTISIGNGCQYKGVVMHEMMHAAGFWHEQSRLDRDNYVTINWHNIEKYPQDMAYNFQKYQHGEADYYGEPYDYDSLMHYENKAFTTNNYPTIVAKGNPQKKLGQRNGFSAIDIRQLNKLYQCSGTGTGGSCVDSDTDCAYWAGKGECQKNADWMSNNCKKSCNKCTPCVDGDANCPYWQSIGECTKNPTYMDANCKKSCNKC